MFIDEIALENAACSSGGHLVSAPKGYIPPLFILDKASWWHAPQFSRSMYGLALRKSMELTMLQTIMPEQDGQLWYIK